MFHRTRKVDDDFMIRGGLPYIQNGIADLQGIFHLGTGKALRTVFKGIISAGLLRKLFQKLCSVHSDLQDLFF